MDLKKTTVGVGVAALTVVVIVRADVVITVH